MILTGIWTKVVLSTCEIINVFVNWVTIESPSEDTTVINRMFKHVAGQFERLD